MEEHHDLIARRLEGFEASATAGVFARAARLRREGVDVIMLCVGEPDSPAPDHVRHAAVAAIESGVGRYTSVSGRADLREAIVADSCRRRRASHRPDQVVVCAGVKHALYTLAEALYDPGDEVIVPAPGWSTYVDQARLCGATPVVLESDASTGFLPTAEALSAALSPRTKAVVFCSPGNPTGAAFDRPVLEALAGVLRDHKALIIADEIYGELLYDGARHLSLVEVAPDLSDRVIIVDGVSKTYAMTGWRVGWMLAPQPVARACERIQSQSITCVSEIAQLGALAALTGSKQPVEAMRRGFESRRDHVLERIQRIDGLSCQRPAGAFYAYVSVESLFGRRAGDLTLADDVAVADWLLDVARVAVVPSSAFGARGHIRLSYAADPAQIDEGLDRIAEAIGSLR